jgi:hypothetical protein
MHIPKHLGIRNKPEYSGRIRGVGKNVRPFSETTRTYYTPTQASSQHSRPFSTALLEEINRAVTLALEAEQEARVAEIQSILEAERKAADDRLNTALASREAKWESRWSSFESMMTPSTSTAAASHDTIPPVTDDPPHHLVISSVGSVYIYNLYKHKFTNLNGIYVAVYQLKKLRHINST